jgi:hypothetical protein
MIIISTYAPNFDTPSFRKLSDIKRKIDIKSPDTIIVVDFNTLLSSID